jgi:eukaryotic-like serine/threonine-protein kinase
MIDGLKIFVIALVTTVASQLLLGPYILKLQGFHPAVATSTSSRPPPAADVKVEPDEEKLAAPNLEGMSVEAARDRFRDKGIVIIEDGERADTGAAPGAIVQQRPPPGTTLASKEIRVIVAKEGDASTVPDVLGQPVQDARSALVTAGFEVPEPTRAPAEGKAPGSVIAQEPNPGASAKAGSIVRLTLAEAVLTKVPKVQGLYLRKATEVLDEVGLKLGKVRRVEHPERGQNYVLGQNPEADAEVEPGTAVDLTVVAPD